MFKGLPEIIKYLLTTVQGQFPSIIKHLANRFLQSFSFSQKIESI